MLIRLHRIHRAVGLVLMVSLFACAGVSPEAGEGSGVGGGRPRGAGAGGGAAPRDGGGGTTGGHADADRAREGSADAGASQETEDARLPASDVAPPADPEAYLGEVVPVLVLTIPGALPTKLGPKVPGTLQVIEEHAGTLEDLASRTPTLETPIGIDVRGSSSSSYPQLPYGIELRDAAGKGKAAALLGLPKEADFVLHSCYADKTCMRNALTYAVGREMAAGRPWWSPRTRWVELVANGKYMGLYLLVEKIKRDGSRLDLPAPAADATQGNVTGAYVFSAEGHAGKPMEDFADPNKGYLRWAYRQPKPDEITPAQKEAVQKGLGDLERALAAPNWKSTYRALVDVPSWVDFFLVQELTKNNDAYYKSWYFQKMPDLDGKPGKTLLGPLWDFDIAYGNVNINAGHCASGMNVEVCPGPFNKPAVLDEAFVGEMRCRWNELRRAGGALDVVRLEGKIDAFARHLGRAKKRDQARWQNVGKYVWPNNYVGATWEDEIAYLKFWLRRRISWLDVNLKGACSSTPAPGQVPPLAAPASVPEKPRGGNTRPYIPIDEKVADPATCVK